ncbi:type IV pili methyl-accepting chemotaxis transducer N-terminal domain-containing protein [Piscinibacter sp.]|jgi:two-component system nitrate/nitrite sensor histidine kinase NarX|uniref:type IV pili methyl-accepting chemotaxis transducer N-terminal domain-containing protein n=1 Tax=Piscinibacter sp. TaxID=1903157 RepID=UPI0035B06389
MPRSPQTWTLGTKLALVASPFLLFGMVLISVTLWVSWQLDGGAAAVNEAGRMRMQTYRIALTVSTGDRAALPALVKEFEASLAVLHHGDPDRPLFLPWDEEVAQRFAMVESDWKRYRERWTSAPPASIDGLRPDSAGFSGHIDALVAAIEKHLSRWTALMHLLQTAMMVAAVIGAAVLMFTGYRLVLEPVGELKGAIEGIQGGNFDTRVERSSNDEFGTLAEGFNEMADHLQQMYRGLEAKVSEKTAQLEEKRERLEVLYDVTALVAGATALEPLAQGFAQRVRQAVHADAVALRWSDETQQRYLMLASEGLTERMSAAEQCVDAGQCHCGIPDRTAPGVRVIPLRAETMALSHCREAGFETVVSVPVRLHERVMGEIDLFFHAQYSLTESERSLLEALALHLAGAIENLRLNALAKEDAVSQERSFIARELHDSIAQSLAFLKIQVQLLRDALRSGDAARMEQAVGEIDAGVRESYGDVRELLMHFRTRSRGEDIEPALQTTLRKFEHQSGLHAELQMRGHGLPLPADTQLQVLHIVQEALSNVRKHAHAARVWVEVQQQPQWRFEVRDDGMGFDIEAGGALDETHVGRRIMVERAERIGAQLETFSVPGRGTSVVLTLPPAAGAAAAPLKDAA